MGAVLSAENQIGTKCKSAERADSTAPPEANAGWLVAASSLATTATVTPPPAVSATAVTSATTTAAT